MSVMQNVILSAKVVFSASRHFSLNPGSIMNLLHSCLARTSVMPPAVGQDAPCGKQPREVYTGLTKRTDERKSHKISQRLAKIKY